MIRLHFINKAIIILFVIFYYCDLILYLGTSYNVNVINSKNITLIVFVPLFAFSLMIGSVKLNSLINKPISRWLIVYLIVSVFALSIGIDRNAAYDNFRRVIFASMIIFMITGIMDHPNNRVVAIKAMIVGMLGSSLINITEFFGITHIGLFSGRPAGFYINPNSAGIALGFGLVLVTAHVPVRWRSLFVIFSGIGMIFTFSRAAFFFFVLYFIYYLFVQRGVSRHVKVLVWLIIVAGGFIFNQKVLKVFNTDDPGVNSNVESRISFMTSPLQHRESIDEGSRLEFLRYSFAQYLERPVLGYGLGYDQTMVHNGVGIESHNQIVHFLLDYGIMGLFLLVYFWVRMGKRLDPDKKIYFRNILFTFIFFSFFSHNLFEEYSMLFILGFTGALLPKTSKHWLKRGKAVLIAK